MFERFWKSYPQPCSKQRAKMAFMQLNPDAVLFEEVMQKLEAQKAFIAKQKSQGIWVPKWKFPANWLTQRAWEEDLSEIYEEINHDKPKRYQGTKSGAEVIWASCKSSLE